MSSYHITESCGRGIVDQMARKAIGGVKDLSHIRDSSIGGARLKGEDFS